MYGLASMVSELLAHGAEIDAEDRHGLTPLLVAVQRGNLEAVQTFVSRGAKTDITDDQGHSLLDIARILGHTNTYLWLERQMTS
ncbi:ankyrin repeat-containing domain protein [Chaetomium strumarium]|uniref:Ankyrin repeat-containing domain protein n=1 Tax=Chaetomium strumarium TaxID=1170767 RepID=A0AAJ0GRS6_9PEZI|nr:ankyrin repeat-containing domain protein [Chaetomium strumarium]